MIDLNTMMAGETLITDPSGICVVLDASKIELTDDQFFRLCRDNSDFHIEMSGKGELIIMAPNRPKTGRQHARFSYRLSAWAEQHGSGDVYDATSEFAFPNGAKRAPDASWILKTRWNALTREQQDAFPAPIVPDFVVEIRSPNDSPPRLKAKMDEYVANGVRLGWLLDPIDNRVSVYRPGEHVQEIENPTILPGDPVLPGFNFDFREILSD
jgi:Uma2 family endonuclease